jgi:hypothetical protein
MQLVGSVRGFVTELIDVRRPVHAQHADVFENSQTEGLAWGLLDVFPGASGQDAFHV